MTLGTHAILVKVTGYKRRQYLTSNGGLTGKRIHAALSSEENAQKVADSLVELNDDVESAEAVSFWKDDPKEEQ